MIKHHLNDALLLSYSAGTLPEAFGLVVAAHVSMCDACRARMEAFDTVGGVLLDAAQTDKTEGVSYEATLARIKTGARQQAPRPMSKPDCPTPLQEYLGGDLTAVKWRPIGMGVRQAILKTSPEATARLLYIPAGIAVPDHGHRGTELTLVLKGAFVDETDRFARGDLEIANQDLHHTPKAEFGEDCICLAATDAPLRFSSLLPRLAARFLRI